MNCWFCPWGRVLSHRNYNRPTTPAKAAPWYPLPLDTPRVAVARVRVRGAAEWGLRSSTISPDGGKVKQVLPEFTMVQHRSDIQILHPLKAYFQCKVVGRNHGDRESYSVRNRNHLEIIRNALEMLSSFLSLKNISWKQRKEFSLRNFEM